MYIFIDESGDPGIKINNGASKTFVIAMIIFSRKSDMGDARTLFSKIRSNLKKPKHFEFKFNKLNMNHRVKVLSLIKKLNFATKVLVINKIHSHMVKNSLKNNNAYNYTFLLTMFLNKYSIREQNPIVTIDKLGDKKFRKFLNQKLQLQKFFFVDSKNETLIQLADLIAGSVFRYYNHPDKVDSSIYFKIISSKIEDLWEI